MLLNFLWAAVSSTAEGLLTAVLLESTIDMGVYEIK
jgi:hypothetical protein